LTADQFIAETEAVYAKYRPAERKYVQQWVAQYKGSLPHLFAEVLRSFSTRWGKPPGIAEFEQAAKEVRMNTGPPKYPALPPGADPAEEREKMTDGDAGEYFEQVWEKIREAAQGVTMEGESDAE
jgi:hypothetical protein